MQATGEFLAQWAGPERAGDTDTLETLLAAGFTAVGPLGSIPSKQAWLARHRSRDLTYSVFSLDEIEDRPIGQDAVLVTRANARGSYQRHPIPEAARATLVLASDARRWRLAAIHMSFIAGTAGAPPIPCAGPGQPQRTGGGA